MTIFCHTYNNLMHKVRLEAMGDLLSRGGSLLNVVK